MTENEKKLLRLIMKELKFNYSRETKNTLSKRLDRVWETCWRYADNNGVVK